MKLGVITFTSVATVLALCGCMANQPQTLNALSSVGKSVQDDAAQILGHPLYATTDKFSFSLASVAYPASGGKHVVPVGNYLLLKTLNAMSGVKSTDIRLDQFSADCNPKGTFMPEVACQIDYQIGFKNGGVASTVEAHLEINIGNWMVKDDSFIMMSRDYGSDPIIEQVRKAVDAVVADIAAKT